MGCENAVVRSLAHQEEDEVDASFPWPLPAGVAASLRGRAYPARAGMALAQSRGQSASRSACLLSSGWVSKSSPFPSPPAIVFLSQANSLIRTDAPWDVVVLGLLGAAQEESRHGGGLCDPATIWALASPLRLCSSLPFLSLVSCLCLPRVCPHLLRRPPSRPPRLPLLGPHSVRRSASTRVSPLALVFSLSLSLFFAFRRAPLPVDIDTPSHPSAALFPPSLRPLPHTHAHAPSFSLAPRPLAS